MKKCILPVLIAALLSCSNAPPADTGQDWPRWRGPNGDGISKEMDWNPQALTGGPKVLWSRDIGSGYSNVIIQSNRLYTMGLTKDGPTFYCLDASSGRVIWRRTLSSSIQEPQSTPVIDGDRVYGLQKDGLIFCLRAMNGAVIWEKDLRKDFNLFAPNCGWATSPVVDGSLLLVNANTAEMALDKATGDLKWTIPDKNSEWGSYATPVLSDFNGTRYALFFGPSTLNAVEVTTGKKMWSFAHMDPTHVVADPIVLGSRVFIQVTCSCTLLETAGVAPEVLWSNSELDTCMPAAVLVSGYLFGTHLPYNFTSRSSWSNLAQDDWPLRCIDWKTGDVMWEKKMKHATLAAADGKLLVLETDGILHIVEATSASYRELSSADVLKGAKKPRIFGSPPVLYGGKVYCRNFAGALLCLDLRK
jgi:outer membrane protein assembly factor BamB